MTREAHNPRLRDLPPRARGLAVRERLNKYEKKRPGRYADKVRQAWGFDTGEQVERHVEAITAPFVARPVYGYNRVMAAFAHVLKRADAPPPQRYGGWYLRDLMKRVLHRANSLHDDIVSSEAGTPGLYTHKHLLSKSWDYFHDLADWIGDIFQSEERSPPPSFYSCPAVPKRLKKLAAGIVAKDPRWRGVAFSSPGDTRTAWLFFHRGRPLKGGGPATEFCASYLGVTYDGAKRVSAHAPFRSWEGGVWALLLKARTRPRGIFCHDVWSDMPGGDEGRRYGRLPLTETGGAPAQPFMPQAEPGEAIRCTHTYNEAFLRGADVEEWLWVSLDDLRGYRTSTEIPIRKETAAKVLNLLEEEYEKHGLLRPAPWLTGREILLKTEEARFSVLSRLTRWREKFANAWNLSLFAARDFDDLRGQLQRLVAKPETSAWPPRLLIPPAYVSDTETFERLWLYIRERNPKASRAMDAGTFYDA